MAADLVRLLGGDWQDDLDLNRLERLASEHVLDNLRTRSEDMPWLAHYKAGTIWPPSAGMVFQFEFQSRPDPDMLERMAEYWALQRRQLRRSRKALGPNGEMPPIVPVVVHTGRGRWTPPCGTGPPRGGNEPPDLFGYSGYRLVDVKAHMGDGAADGNLARAVFALDAARADGVSAAVERVAKLLGEAADEALSRSFRRWCRGVLGRRLTKRLPSLANLTEDPFMLAQTLREWEKRSIRRGREEGVRRGREESARLLCNLAARRFGGATADAIRPLLGSMRDEISLAAVGALIVDSETGTELLDGMRRLAQSR